MATGKIVVKALDMGQEIKDEAVKVAKEALAEHKLERDIAKHVKQLTTCISYLLCLRRKRKEPLGR